MLVVVKGKNLELTESLKNYAEQKVSKLDRYLDNITEASVELTTEHTRSAETRFVAQVTMLANGTILRGEERASDLYTAIDTVTDVMQRQIVRYKEKLYGRGRAAAGRAGAQVDAASVAKETPTVAATVVRTKRFAIKPMEVDEAIEQMDLLSHDFYVFRNAATDEVNVVYRRKDGNYGLIEPEPEE